MMQVCPVCNGLTEILAACPYCEEEMNDQGAATDCLGPYAPYELVASEVEPENCCLHAVICGNCGFCQNVAIPLLPSPE